MQIKLPIFPLSTKPRDKDQVCGRVLVFYRIDNGSSADGSPGAVSCTPVMTDHFWFTGCVPKNRLTSMFEDALMANCTPIGWLPESGSNGLTELMDEAIQNPVQDPPINNNNKRKIKIDELDTQANEPVC